MQTEKKERTGLQKTARILLKVILFLFLFIIVVFLLVLTPPVQNFATGRIENYLEKKLKTRVEIGSISVRLPRKISLQNIYIEDQTKDTLVAGGTINADLALFKLMSNEVQVKSLELSGITAKVKRILPDTVFNFQFIVDAFITEQSKTDTAATALLKLNVDDIKLDDFRVVYQDVLTGNDMFGYIKGLTAHIDTLNPYLPHYDIASLKANGIRIRFTQNTPLIKPEPISKDLAEAVVPTAMKLNFGNIILDDVFLDYGNDVSAFFTQFTVGHLELDGKQLDLQNRIIHFDKLHLDNSLTAIKLGKKVTEELIEKELKQEIAAQKQNDWSFRIDEIRLNNNTFQFDNDNTPTQKYGLDFAHMRGDSLTLHAENLVLNKDSTGILISKGSFKEKSGFILQALEGDLLYAHNQSYLKNLYLKTPGTELKRNAILEYASYEALANSPSQTVMDIELVNSYVQVKDILSFAPQLRGNPAFRNPSDVWHLNIIGSGTLDRLNFEALQFEGLKDTRLDAYGTLASVTDPNAAGGNFTIRKFHTSQSDIALLTGQRLSTPEINLSETFDASGTLSGNMNNLATNLRLNTSSGGAHIRGRFSNLTNPAKAKYNAQIDTRSLQLGKILRNPQIGTVSANMNFSGTGFTPDAINTTFKGNIYALGFNKYTYRNIRLNGSLKQTAFNVNADIRDPNIDLTAQASGNFAATSSFKLNAMVDSIKTLPLHFTTEPLSFHGKVDADITTLNADYLEGTVLISKALLVSKDQRLPIDTMNLVSSRNETGQFIDISSDVINARMEGQYRITDLGYIIQNNIQPYFSVSTDKKIHNVKPYDFTFRADITNSPFISAFVPGLEINEPIHAEGSLATGNGLQASITTPSLIYGTNTVEGLNVNITTTAAGLQIAGNVGRLKSGDALNIFNTQLNATIANNVINFNLNIDDQNKKNKYKLGGELSQPVTGTYSLHLNPDSLFLNYERWTTSPDNNLTISPTSVNATNFLLQKGDQKLLIESHRDGNSPLLHTHFTNFRVATITGFMKSDSVLVDGVMNGTVSFTNIMKQPLFVSDLMINDLSLKKDTIGNVSLKVSNTVANTYNTNITVSGRGNDVQVTGTLVQGAKDVALDLNVAIRKLELSTMEGAAATAFKNMRGTINGGVKIDGTLAAPEIDGKIYFNDAVFNTVFLGGDFRIDNEKLVAISNEGLIFNQFTIRDSANNALTLDGTVGTSNFINYRFDMDVNANNFRALNTTKKDNKIYYGQLYLTSNMHIGGTEERPVIDGAVTINDKTNLTVVIPQPEPGVSEREGIIQFVDMDAPENDSLFLAAYDSLNTSNLIGFDIAANIEIRKEAILNLIIDEANGDFVNIQGEAQLTAGIDPSGKINLIGSYEIERGAYEISFNFLRRKFEIEKGSKIIWMGEPTGAELAVTAIYIANTAPLDLVEQQVGASQAALRNTYLQKLPFEVHLKVGGQLMQPEISFDIVLPEDKNYNVAKDVVPVVQAKLAQIRQEPGEIEKQVFSLLLLNRFIGENPFQSSSDGFSASSFARQSVSKLLTEQLNSLASGLIQGVDINFDVASSDDYTTGSRRSRTDLNVGLSKRLLNDRLTVTVGSNFELEGPQNTNQKSNNFAGDISVNYQLSKDGRYLIRAYRINEYDALIEGHVIETGIGFIINVDYDHFREVLRGKKAKVKTAEELKKTDE